MQSLPVRLSAVWRSLALSVSVAVSAAIALHSPVMASSPGSAAPSSNRSLVKSRPLTHSHPLTKPRPLAKPLSVFSPNKASVYAGELSLAGVSLYSTKEDVLWMLGDPKSSETLPGSFVSEIFYYGGISISFAGGQVWDIIATSPKFCTPSGVCPGDSVSRVFNTLGPTDIIGQSAVYTASGMGGCVLDLGIAYDAVSQIKLICQ